MTKAQDYIFCPLCGEHEWKVDKTKNNEDGSITEHKCGDCRKFIYTEIGKSTKTESGLQIFYRELYTEEVTVDEYHLHINHLHDWTEISRDGDVILNLQRAVKIDWYKETGIKDKIKKFLVFS